ncbi:MAG: hypothetical protein Q4B73_00665 [Lachnospiraceae bacterium]|nr:hypothetical protein [Lachnospiraceae bacterium]
MRKYGQREIKALVKSGAAVDISNHDNAARHELEAQETYLEKIGYSSGVYGLNGGLLKGHESGKLYAITGRTTALFIYF